MPCFQHSRKSFPSRHGFIVLSAALLWSGLAVADRFPPDPVDDLRQDLRGPDFDLKARDKALSQRIDALRSIPEMRRALLLNDWRIEESTAREAAPVDRRNRAVLVERFEKAVRKMLRQGSISARIAALNSLAEIGPNARTPEDKEGIGRGFGPDIADIMAKGEAPVLRAAAAKTMGHIFPEPKLAAQALGGLLKSGDVNERRAAAAGLVSLVRVATQLVTGSESTGKVKNTLIGASAVARAGQAAAPVAATGLADPDSGVRRLCAEALQQAAAALVATLPHQSSSAEAPPKSDLDTDKSLQQTWADLRPLMEALKEQAPALARALGDTADAKVRGLTARTLEDMATARDQFQRANRDNVPSKPLVPGTGTEEEASLHSKILSAALQKPAPKESQDPLLDGLRIAVPALARALSDPVEGVRLKVVDALETIGPEAAPAAPALTKALSDSNRFVRWAAARALGKIGPENAESAVPALARLLQDEDYDVNLAAAHALDRFGPSAKAAVPALIKALSASDADKRKAVLKSLESIGTDSSSAVPAISKALADEDPSVRKLAAEVLGKFGSAASSAEPALRRALDDPDLEVRRAASDALLNIHQ